MVGYLLLLSTEASHSPTTFNTKKGLAFLTCNHKGDKLISRK